MSLFASAFTKSATTSEAIWLEMFGRRNSKSGKTVNLKTALDISTVFAANRVIGNGIAQVPLKLMRESPDGKERVPAKDHQLYNLLALCPNRWQTSFQFRQDLSWSVELVGNHFSFINRIGGRVMELFPFPPGACKIVNLGRGEFKYMATAPDGTTQEFPAESILHCRGPSINGFEGLEVLTAAREAIGLAMAIEESAATLHKNSVNTSGAYSIDGKLGDGQYQQLSDWIEKFHAGAENAGRPLILDRAAKWQSITMTNRDAQSLETRGYQVEEICRFFGVMPIMVGYSDKAATYASAEQMFLAHLQHCLAPRWTNYEQILAMKLLTQKERAAGYYFDFVEEGMIRASIADTQTTILGYVNGGVMTANEGRAKLDLNPDADPASDKLRIPANITGKSTEPPPADPVKLFLEELDYKVAEIKTLLDKPSPVPAPPVINVDARTEVNQAPAPANLFTVNLPEMKASDVTVEPAVVNVNVEASEIKVEPPVVNVNVEPAEVNLEATLPTPTIVVSLPARKTTTTVARDKDGNIETAEQIEQDIVE